LTSKLPAETSLSKEADNLIPNVDEQGFQVVTSKATKKAVMKASTQGTSKSKPYITISKVGTPKPFR